MKALIGGWRQAWGYDFPFYFVQIAPFAGYGPGELPALWEAQVASLKNPQDRHGGRHRPGRNIRDIHPPTRSTWATAWPSGRWPRSTARQDLVYSGPLYKSMKIEGDKMRLPFAHVGGGLKSRDGKPLSEFEIAAADGKFVPAEATIDGDTVVVEATAVRRADAGPIRLA